MVCLRSGKKVDFFSRGAGTDSDSLKVIRKLLDGHGMLTDDRSMIHLVAQILQALEMDNFEAGL